MQSTERVIIRARGLSQKFDWCASNSSPIEHQKNSQEFTIAQLSQQNYDMCDWLKIIGRKDGSQSKVELRPKRNTHSIHRNPSVDNKERNVANEKKGEQELLQSI